jgi:hypothetical protein
MGNRPLCCYTIHTMKGRPFHPGASSRVATSEARSRSPQAGALPHFPPMCTTAQTRSVPRPSFPNCRLRENQRLIPASLQLCHSERVQRAPELLARPQDHLCYAVQPTQPFLSILQAHFPSRSARSPAQSYPPTNDEVYRWPCILTGWNRTSSEIPERQGSKL